MMLMTTTMTTTMMAFNHAAVSRLVVLCLMALAVPSMVMGSSSSSGSRGSKNYNAYNYDTATPTFTPDGRLLQVEYASMASSHSFPLVVLRLPDNGNDRANTNTSKNHGGDEGSVLIVTMSSSSQRRIVSLERSDCVVAMSGVLSDSLVLLRKVFKQMQTNLGMYGNSGPSSSVVETVSSACQEHAFGGGLRPYGSTFVVVSNDGDSTPGRVEVSVTDPSGGVKSLSDPIVVVGSTKNIQSNIRKQCEAAIHSDNSIADSLRVVARVLLEQHRERQSQRVGKRQKDKDNNDNKDNNDSDVTLEAAIVSPKHGIFRLDDAQTQDLMQKVVQQR